MTNTTNNTTILTAAETAELFAGSTLIEGGEIVMEDTLHNVTEAVESIDVGGKVQYANFDVQGSRTRKWFLENVGPDMDGITTLDAALKLSGLDYNVIKVPVSYNINQGIKGMPPKFIKIPDKFAVVREDTRDVLGIVGARYNLLQNHEAFNFMESLVELGASIESASTFGPGNARSFICMKTENMDILGDIYTPYFVLLNGFDGGQTVKISFINERVYCKNMLNRALKNAQNTISIRHSNKMMDRLDTARAILTAEAQHTYALKEKAELLALKPMDENAFYLWATDLFPIAKIDDTPITQRRNQETVDILMACYREPDLNNIRNTGWGAIQAVADFETHTQGFKASRRPELDAFNRVVTKEMPVLNNIWSYVENLV